MLPVVLVCQSGGATATVVNLAKLLFLPVCFPVPAIVSVASNTDSNLHIRADGRSGGVAVSGICLLWNSVVRIAIPWYSSTIGTRARTSQWYSSTMVPCIWYTCTMVRTNITLSQKQLEIQALRCNGDTTGSGRVVTRVLEYVHVYVPYGTRVPWYVLEYRGTRVLEYVPWYSEYSSTSIWGPLFGTTGVPWYEYHGTRVPHGMVW